MNKPAFTLARFNRPETWLCLAGILFYVLALTFLSLGENPTRYSLAFAELQAFFRGLALVFGGMCVSILCTRHSIAKSSNTNLENSAIYFVRVLMVLVLVLAAT